MNKCYQISIGCEYENLPATFTIRIVEIEKNIILSEIIIFTHTWKFQGYCRLLGCDIFKFIKELKKIYEFLDNKAELITFDENVKICFKVFEKGRGKIIISGQITFIVPLEYIYPSLSDTEVKFIFSGLITDQSYLPNFIQTLQDFIIETGIPIQSPWENYNNLSI